MPSGTWSIFNPQTAAYETLDKSSQQHQAILRSEQFVLRDNGFNGGAVSQETADCPVSGNYTCLAAPVDISVHTAGTILPAVVDPEAGADKCVIAGGAGSQAIAGTVSVTADAARAAMYVGYCPPRWRWRVTAVSGAGSFALLCVFMRNRAK
jgi:hypothetical protein